ncbi:hypothetical protein GCM10022404_26930 [Celeribacter arenosi]|uniref:Uncharacterized protein n=1 Tax=Celeribacter arenosi TaxID=792649 RepID=A0ABP7KH37_9RHOB
MGQLWRHFDPYIRHRADIAQTKVRPDMQLTGRESANPGSDTQGICPGSRAREFNHLPQPTRIPDRLP